MSSTLRADVYLAPGVQVAGSNNYCSPISSTLIHGQSEAILVDTPLTFSQTKDLIQWIEQTIPNKTLKYIYITHGHGDHFFGISTLQKRWPECVALATPGTVAHMKEQLQPIWFESLWMRNFPGDQIAQPVSIAEPMDASSTIWLEGHALHAIECGETDTQSSTVLHVADLQLVVCGDVVYGDVHPYLVEANTAAKRASWIRAIELVQSLNPHLVVAGHKKTASAIDGAYYLGASKKYIEDFDSAFKTAKAPRELIDAMMKLYPDRLNPFVLAASAASAFKPVASA